MVKPRFSVTGNQNRYFRLRPVGKNAKFEICVIDLPYTVVFETIKVLYLYLIRKIEKNLTLRVAGRR